ncbi:unnamed protein product, partial [Rotaria socialis]
MTNSSNNTFINLKNETRASFTAYYPLALITVGTLLNTFTFIILCQPAFKNTAAKPTIHYMRAIAIFDIIMLYGWNFDHYLLEVHGYTLQLYSVPFCLYNCIPFILMVAFDSGVIYHLIRADQVTTIQHQRIQHRSITITLVITTVLFLTMTIPATVFYGFFTSTASYVILHLLDSLLYTYHILSF